MGGGGPVMNVFEMSWQSRQGNTKGVAGGRVRGKCDEGPQKQFFCILSLDPEDKDYSFLENVDLWPFEGGVRSPPPPGTDMKCHQKYGTTTIVHF